MRASAVILGNLFAKEFWGWVEAVGGRAGREVGGGGGRRTPAASADNPRAPRCARPRPNTTRPSARARPRAAQRPAATARPSRRTRPRDRWWEGRRGPARCAQPPPWFEPLPPAQEHCRWPRGNGAEGCKKRQGSQSGTRQLWETMGGRRRAGQGEPAAMANKPKALHRGPLHRRDCAWKTVGQTSVSNASQ